MHTIYISSVLKGQETNHKTALAYIVEARKTDEESGKLLEIMDTESFITLKVAVYAAYKLGNEYQCKVFKEWQTGITRELTIECYAMEHSDEPDSTQLASRENANHYDVSVLNSDTTGNEVTMIIEEFEDLTLDEAGKILDGLEQKYDIITSWIEA